MKHSHVPFVFCCLTTISCGENANFRGELSSNSNGTPTQGEYDTFGATARFFSFTGKNGSEVSLDYDLSANKNSMEFDVQNPLVQESQKFVQTPQNSKPNADQQQNQKHPTKETVQSAISGALDIAVIIDNSPSMAEEQNKLAEKLSVFLSEIHDVDWRMAIVTTDYREKPGDKNNPRPNVKWCEYLTPNSKDLNVRFKNAIQAGTNGSDIETAFLRMEHLFKYQCVDAPTPWFRADAPLAVLIVSDEDNCSDGTECWGTNPETEVPYRSPNQFLELLKSQGKTLGTTARVYGLIGDPTDPSSNCAKTAAHPAKEYAQVIQATNGVSGPICDPTYEPVLKHISKDFRKLTQFNIKLAHAPMANEPVQIFVNGTSLSSDHYSVAANVVSISSENIQKGDSVEVNYVWNEKGEAANQPPPLSQKNKTFQTKDLNRADVRNVQVLVNNTPLPPDSWSLDKEGTLVLKDALDDAAQVEIRYSRGKKKQNTYSIAENIVPASLEVCDSATGAIVAASFDGHNVSFSDEQSQSAKRVRISYTRLAATDPKTIRLPSVPIVKKLIGTVNGEPCELEVSAELVATPLCPMSAESKISIRYTEQGCEDLRTFTLDSKIDHENDWNWTASVNGKDAAVDHFSANSFTLSEQPPNGARIQLTLIHK